MVRSRPDSLCTKCRCSISMAPDPHPGVQGLEVAGQVVDALGVQKAADDEARLQLPDGCAVLRFVRLCRFLGPWC